MLTCNNNPVSKYIRVVLSLIIIGLGIYYRSWIGLFGVLTLIAAFVGRCNSGMAKSATPKYFVDIDKKDKE
jgi:hypothetical protein